jgi:signal transduction histidine kinase
VQVGASTYLVSAFEIADHVVRPGRALLLTEITAQKTVEAELRELDRARSELVNTVTHELRTPLTSIVGYTEILMDRTTEDDGDTRRLLEVIDRNDRRLLDMVANLLQLSALDASPDWLNGKEVEQVDLNAVVAAVHEVLLPQARSGGLELDVRTEPALPPVAGDSAQLERVLLNLGSNAIKFSAAGGIVTICTGTDSGHVFAEVVDQGMGMSEEDIAHLGDKFFRTRSARGVQGTGLGLAVVRTIVERHRGTLSVASEVGVGTRMRISFPRAHQRVGS